MKKDPLSGLAQSLQDENIAVEKRFEQANQLVEAQRSPPQRQALDHQAAKKTFLIRDTFSFPEFDHALLFQLQARCLEAGHHASKSELVRAGLKVLIQMNSTDLLSAARAVEKLKPGRSTPAASPDIG